MEEVHPSSWVMQTCRARTCPNSARLLPGLRSLRWLPSEAPEGKCQSETRLSPNPDQGGNQNCDFWQQSAQRITSGVTLVLKSFGSLNLRPGEFASVL
eukprot:799909-Amphidinium_carterae.1